MTSETERVATLLERQRVLSILDDCVRRLEERAYKEKEKGNAERASGLFSATLTLLNAKLDINVQERN